MRLLSSQQQQVGRAIAATGRYVAATLSSIGASPVSYTGTHFVLYTAGLIDRRFIDYSVVICPSLRLPNRMGYYQLAFRTPQGSHRGMMAFWTLDTLQFCYLKSGCAYVTAIRAYLMSFCHINNPRHRILLIFGNYSRIFLNK